MFTAGTVFIVRFETLNSAESLHSHPCSPSHPISHRQRFLSDRQITKRTPGQHIIDDARRSDLYQQTNIQSAVKGGASRGLGTAGIAHSHALHSPCSFLVPPASAQPQRTSRTFLPLLAAYMAREQISMRKRLKISAGMQNTAPSYG